VDMRADEAQSKLSILAQGPLAKNLRGGSNTVIWV